ESTGAAPIPGPRWVRSRMRVLDEKRRSPVCAGNICGDAGVVDVAAQGRPEAAWLVLHRTSPSACCESVLQDLVRSADRSHKPTKVRRASGENVGLAPIHNDPGVVRHHWVVLWLFYFESISPTAGVDNCLWSGSQNRAEHGLDKRVCNRYARTARLLC